LASPLAVDALISVLTDDWVNVRIYAVQSLGKIGDRRAVSSLIGVLENESENDLVRAGAAAALGMLKDTKALMPLRNLIMKAEDLGEIEDTALKAYKMIMAANWKGGPAGNAKRSSAAK